MTNCLVGYTGFVGGNIAAKGTFDGLFNSKNIQDAYGSRPDLLVYAGVRAEMFLANKYPEKDLAQLDEAFDNMVRIQPKTVVLVSTISVYGENPAGDEDSVASEDMLTAYGKNRLYLERKVAGQFKDCLVVRLPALYGRNIKKNFIHDYINVVPSLLKYEKFDELVAMNGRLGDYYERQENGFYSCRDLSGEERVELKAFFKSCGFSALNFTDSRSRYQFYNLGYLWGHIQKALEKGIHRLNITAEPVAVSELYEYLEGKPFVNELARPPFVQDLRSKHAELFGGRNGYFFDRDFVMEDIKRFVEGERI
ncbi:MAG: hypothetical protein ILP18_10975 [Treponema sp.]|nr:hypothetical protein [Treponema sp.]